MKKISAQRGFTQLIVLLIILVGIGIGVYLTQHPQIFKSGATNDQTRLEIFGPTVSNGVTTSRNVSVRLTYVPPNQITQKSDHSLISKAYAASCNPSGGIDPKTWTLIEAYTCDPNNLGAAGQEWACFGSDGTPKAIKFSADVLDSARCPAVAPSAPPVSACLPGCCGGTNNMCGSCPNGQLCRISNGACQSGLSCDPGTGVAPSPSPVLAGTQTTSYGMQIDIRDNRKVPNAAQMAALAPQWVRFPFPCVNSSANGNSCPNDFHSTNLISTIPSGVKKLAIITNDTTWNAPIGSTDVGVWKNYVDQVYVPTVRKIVSDYSGQINAIELWNEEDLNAGPFYDPYIPPSAFAYLVAQASLSIKTANPNLQVVVGGLASGLPSYLHQVYQADNQFAQYVDAIGVHPYQAPPNIGRVSGVVNELNAEISADKLGKPVWVTEIGIEQYNNSTSPKNQAEFLTNVFNQFQAISPQPQFVNWYAFSDLMDGVGGGTNWGLVDQNGNIKDVGTAFGTYASQVASKPTPTLVYPTAYRIANSQTDLSGATEYPFVQNSPEMSWQLTPGNGLKTVYGQFKVNGLWQPAVSASVTLQEPASPTPTATPQPTAAGACLPGCCGGTNNMCGSCPNGQLCRIGNGACRSGVSCDPRTGLLPVKTPVPTPTPTPTATPKATPITTLDNAVCAQCIINARPDLIPFYQGNGWDTSPANYQSIVSNWCGIDPAGCFKAKTTTCSLTCVAH